MTRPYLPLPRFSPLTHPPIHPSTTISKRSYKMKAYFKPSSILFYLLSALLFFLLGTVLAGIAGAGKGQGLAGGAIVLGYGVMAGCFALIAAIVTVGFVKESRVRSFNKILAAIFVLLIIFIIYRFQTRQTARNQAKPSQFEKTAYPAATAVVPAYTQDQYTPPMGLGMGTPKFYEYDVVYFYGNPNLEKPVSDHTPTDSLVFQRTEIGMELTSAPPWFVPAHLKLDYDMLFLRVVSIHSEFIEVMANETNGQTAYMDRSKFNLRFWPEFLLTINSIEPLFPQDYPVRVKPLSHAGIVSTPYAFLKPLKISSQWMQVELLDEHFKSHGKGWIMWRENDRLLIAYSLLS